MLYYIGQDPNHRAKFTTATVQDAVDYLQTISIFTVDTETTGIPVYKDGERVVSKVYEGGLDPYLSKIIMLQVGDMRRQYVIDCRTEDVSAIMPLFADSSKLKILHNAKFDIKHLHHNFGAEFENIWDTMLVQNVLDNGRRVRFSMDKVAERLLGIKPKKVKTFDLFEQDEAEEYADAEYRAVPNDVLLMDRAYVTEIDKSIREAFATKGDKPFTPEEVMYGADDVTIPYRIYLKQREILATVKSNWDPSVGIRLENKYCIPLAFKEYYGFRVVPEKWMALYEKNLGIRARRLEALNKYVEQHPKLKHLVQMDLFSQVGCIVNWSSSSQVVEVFRKLGICPRLKSKATKKEEWTVSAKALYMNMPQNERDMFDEGVEPEEMKHVWQFRLMYMLYSKSVMHTTTFGSEYLRYVHPVTGKFHPTYRQMLDTTRISSTQPNLQNIPSGSEWRECFVPDDGTVMICTDYASQESRVLADVSGVEILVSFFRDGHEIFGDDMHSLAATFMQRAIRKDPNLLVTKKSDPQARQKAKSLNFALCYGATAHSLMYTLNTDFEEAERLIDAYFEGFPGLREDFEMAKSEALSNGFIVLDKVTQKRYWFPHFKEMQQAKDKALSLYPEGWQEKMRKMSPPEKAAAKLTLYAEIPEIPVLWKQYMVWRGELERKGLNYRIQGLSASMTKTAECYIWDACKGHPYRRLILSIHDEILCQTIKSDAAAFSAVIKEAMLKAGRVYCPSVPMGAEPEEATYWKH